MKRHLKRRLALIVALAAVLAGGTAVALAATGKHAGARHSHRHHAHGARSGSAAGAHGRHGLLLAASSYLGAAPAELRTDLASGKTLGQIADATPGRSEAGLVAALVTAAQERLRERASSLTPQIEELVKGVPGASHAAAGRHRSGLLAAALGYLGLTRKQLSKQRHAGLTLAQIAQATPGKSEAGLRAALLAAAEQRRRTRAHGLAPDQLAEQHRQARVKARINQMLHRSRPGHGLKAAAKAH